MSRKALYLLCVVTTFSLIFGKRGPECMKLTLDPMTTTLNCRLQTRANAASVSFRWLKDKTTLIYDGKKIAKSQKKDYDIRQPYMYDRNLVIKGTRRALEGQYQCWISNGSNVSLISCYNVSTSIPSNSEEKSTTEPPVGDTYSKTVTTGDTVDLWCNHTDDTMWYVVDGDTQEDINIRGRKLQIRDISQDCGNVFKCKKDEKELCTWKLNILPKLTILVNGLSENETKTKKNDHITISCTGVTSYKLRFRWYYQEDRKKREEFQNISDNALVHTKFGRLYNVTVSENSQGKHSYITFRSQKQTKGRYRCEAQVVDTMENTNLITKSNTVKVN